MFGFACDESPELMPLPIALAHRLTRGPAEVRKNGTLPWLRPDGKSLVTVEYSYGQRQRVGAVVISTQHAPEIEQEQIARYICKHLIDAKLLDDETRYFINPTGCLVVGGPHGDSGPTGSKIIDDTYGGMAAIAVARSRARIRRTAPRRYDAIERAIAETFDLRAAGIIRALELRRPIFEQTAGYGHFGRNDSLAQRERTDTPKAYGWS